MGGVPSVPHDKSRTLQVIGAGYSRTGTVSMSMALETLLDGPVMHGGTQLLGREDAYVKLWTRIFENRHNKPVLLKLLQEATAGFVGITDAPGATMFTRELLELYPDAKVVLVERDLDRWWKSMEPIMRNTGMPPWLMKTLTLPCPTWRWIPSWIQGMGDCEGERFTSVFTKERLLEYNDWVRDSVSNRENLLCMSIKEGWEPLAKFLDKPIPSEPFPRANDSAAAEAVAKKIIMTASLIWLGILTTVTAAGYSGWYTWKTQYA